MDIKRLGILIFVIGTLFDTVAVALPNVFTRTYIAYLPFIGILVFYLGSAKKYDYFYLVALFSAIAGIYFYDEVRVELSEFGLMFYMASIFIFVLKAVDNSEIFSMSSIAMYAALVTFVLGTIVYVMLMNVNGLMFFYTVLYAVILGALSFLGIINYRTHKNQKNRILFWSSILFVANAVTASYSLFWGVKFLLRSVELLSFSTAHLLMCFYMLYIDKEKQLNF